MNSYPLVGVRIVPADDELSPLSRIDEYTDCPPGSDCAQAAVERVRRALQNQKRTYSLTKRTFVEKTER